MMPRLHAQDMLDAANAAALGSGALPSGDAARMRGALERAAGERAAPIDPRALAMMGVGVEFVGGTPPSFDTPAAAQDEGG